MRGREGEGREKEREGEGEGRKERDTDINALRLYANSYLKPEVFDGDTGPVGVSCPLLPPLSSNRGFFSTGSEIDRLNSDSGSGLEWYKLSPSLAKGSMGMMGDRTSPLAMRRER